MLLKSIVSRTLLLNTLKCNTLKQSRRNGSHGVWAYRMPPPPPSKRALMLGQVLGGICWWWILYHIATEPEHIYGEWAYVDPSTWSNEELGIPPDSYGPLKK